MGAADAAADAGADAAPVAVSAGPFVWPLSAWVSANDFYARGSPHTGSADFAAPHHTPLRPARDGVVTKRGWNNIGGWHVLLEHQGADGQRYTTYYAHLIDEPPVKVGDEVRAFRDGGTLLGRVSRTGHASSPHTHFAIRRLSASGEATLLVIPGLKIGDWVESGQTIPGSYPGLSPLPVTGGLWRPFRVRANEPAGLRLYASTAREPTAVVATVAAGAELEVLRGDQGQYEVKLGDTIGWVPWSGTVPAGATLFGVKTAPGATKNVRDAPSGNDIGDLPPETLLTGVEDDGAAAPWYRVQWRCTAETNNRDDPADDSQAIGGCPSVAQDPNRSFAIKYGWVAASVSSVTAELQATTWSAGLSVYASKPVDGVDEPDLDAELGELPTASRVTVVETRDGWYKIDHQGNAAWIRGWHTAGRM